MSEKLREKFPSGPLVPSASSIDVIWYIYRYMRFEKILNEKKGLKNRRNDLTLATGHIEKQRNQVPKYGAKKRRKPNQAYN